jgi:MinD-like ATPase involved in chromosome partitioning or flagellar assembly
LLPAPLKPEYAEFVKPEHIIRIIDTFKKYFDYIVIDCPNSVNENVLATFDKSTKIIFLFGNNFTVFTPLTRSLTDSYVSAYILQAILKFLSKAAL